MLRLLSRAWAASLLVTAALGACSTAPTTTTIAPLTGIVVRAQSLVAAHGCGSAPDQVFKYVAVVTTPPDATGTRKVLGASVNDCFADAKFVNLPANSDGTQAYALDVFAFDAADFAAAQIALQGAGETYDARGLAGAATWTAACTATQQPNIEVLAVCEPLHGRGPSDAGAPDAASDAAADAADATTPVDASGGDAGADAALDAGVDASDAAMILDGSGGDAAADAPLD